METAISGNTFLFQAYGFFLCDFAERVHRHLDAGEVDAGIVCLDANLDVVVDDAFTATRTFISVLLLR